MIRPLTNTMSISSFHKNILLIPALFFLLAMVSCSSTKKTKYFQDIPDSGRMSKIARVEYIEPIIKVDDILTILIQTLDPLAATSINTGNVPSPGTGTMVGSPSISQQTSYGYLVDKAGEVELPVLGKVKLAGLTTAQAKEVVRTAALTYFKDPTVSVRYANFKISVTGEVTKPGTYVVPNEKVTILDALALAGDLTIFGKRDNVLLIREEADGTKTPYRVNLKKSNIMSSPYYYLRQNDYIYVEPNKGKAAANDAAQTRNYAIIGSILSVLIIFVSRR
jgi:polysaccharide export outer membrane protein